MLHDTLVDLTEYNNIIYNTMLKNLHLQLDNYGIKVSNKISKYNPSLYKLFDYSNDDTTLLHKLLNNYNKVKSLHKYKYFERLKKLIMNRLRTQYETGRYKKYTSNVVDNHFLYNKYNKRRAGKVGNKFKDDIELKESISQLFKGEKEEYTMLAAYHKSVVRKMLPSLRAPIFVSKYIRLKKIPLSILIINELDEELKKRETIIYWLDSLVRDFERYKYLSRLIYFRKGLRYIYLLGKHFYEDRKYR